MFALRPRADSLPSSRRSSISSQFSARSEYQEKKLHLEGNVKWLGTLDCGSEVMCCKFNRDGNLIAVGLRTGAVKMYNPENGLHLHTLVDDDTNNAHLPCTSVRFVLPQPDDHKEEHKHLLLATYASGMVKFWHYTSGKCIHTINEVRQTLTSAFTPGGEIFLTAGADPQIQMYDTATKRKIRTFEPSDSRDVMNGHRLRVFALQVHPNNPNEFISGGWDDTIQFWDMREKHAVRKLYGPHICGEALDIDPVHNHILTGSWRKESILQIWDYSNGEKIKDVPIDKMHTSLLYSAQWLGKEFIVCGGSEQDMAMLIDRGTLNVTGQVVDLGGGVYCIDNTRLGANPKVAVGSQDQVHIIKNEKM